MVSNLEYSIKDLHNLKEGYVGKGIKFDSKMFFFWKNRSNKVLREIVVIFDNDYGNIEVLDGMIVVSLAGLKNETDLRQALKIFSGILNNSSVKFTFLVASAEEKRMAEGLGNLLGNIYEVKNGEEYINSKREVVEPVSVANSLGFNDVKPVIRSEVNSSVVGNDSELGSTEKGVATQKKQLLEKWATDPVMLEKISKLSKEELDKELNLGVNKSVDMGETVVPFKSTLLDDSGDRRLLSIGKDDLGSGEKKVITFPVRETVSEVKATPVEKTVAPVTSANLNYSYNDDVPVLGNNDSSLNVGSSNVYSKPKVRTLSKPSMSSSGMKRAGFISFPVVIFVFSFILLVVSAVLLFVVD